MVSTGRHPICSGGGGGGGSDGGGGGGGGGEKAVEGHDKGSVTNEAHPTPASENCRASFSRDVPPPPPRVMSFC